MAGRERRPGARAGSHLGVAAGVLGLAASLFVLFGPVASYASAGPGGAAATGTVSGIGYLTGAPGARVELLAWPLGLALVSVLGTAGARQHRAGVVWFAGLSLAAFAALGAMSVGLLFAPAALLMVLAAALLSGR